MIRLARLLALLIVLCGGAAEAQTVGLGPCSLTGGCTVAAVWTASTQSSGTNNAQVVTTNTGDFTLQAGNAVIFVPGITNTGATTVNVDGQGAVAVRFAGAPIPANVLVIGEAVTLVYNGSSFDLPVPATINGATGDISNATVVATGTSTPRTLAARAADVLNVEDDGVVCDGSTDVSSLLSSVLNSNPGKKIVLPAGRCILNNAISVTLASQETLSISGQGRDQTVLVWTGSGGGLTVNYVPGGYWTQNPQGNGVTIEDMTFATSFGSSGGTGLAIEGNFVTSRPTPATILRNLTFRGDGVSLTTNAWTTALSIHNAVNVTIEDPYIFMGANSTVGTSISVTGSSSSVTNSVIISNPQIYWGNIGVSIGAYVQGVSVADGALTFLNNGILFAASNSAPEVGMSIHGNVIQASSIGIGGTSIDDNQIFGNLIYLGTASGNNPTGIALEASGRSVISGNTIVMAMGITGTAITFTNTSGRSGMASLPSMIAPNTIVQAGGTTLNGIVLGTGTAGVSIAQQAINITSGTPYSDSGTSNGKSSFLGSVNFSDGSSWSSAGISDTASYNTSTTTAPVNFTHTNNYSTTSNGVVGMEISPVLTAAGASASTNQAGVRMNPTFGSGNLNIAGAFGLRLQAKQAVGYTGTIAALNALQVDTPALNSGNPITAYDAVNIASIANGNGISTGSVTNIGMAVNGASAAAASGGTITNEGIAISLPSGTNAGTATNVGLLITGNGQTGGAVTNYAIDSISTAPSNFSGPLILQTLTGSSLVYTDGSKNLTSTAPSQTANTVFAAPNGNSGAASFRSLVGADLPNPSASTLGGVQSIAAVSHQFLTSISTSGVPAQAQPAIGDISGFGTGVATALGAAVSGSGSICLTTNCSMTTPALGTPSALVGTNISGTAASLTAGTATVANGLKSATTTVVVSAATAPTANQVLTASSGTAASWVLPMILYGTTGTQQTTPHMVIGSTTLSGGNATITLTGSAVYTSTGSYACSGNDTGGSALAVSIQNQSASSFKIFGTLTDTVSFSCVGN